MTTAIKLQKQIMRRVYYTYGIRLATHPLTLHGLVLFAAIFVLTRLVHVAAVFNNLAAVQAGEVVGYVASMLFHAEVAVLLLMGICFFTMISLWGRVPVPRFMLPRAV